MATFRKRGSSWQVQIRTKGQPPLSRSFTTKSAGQAWVDSLKDGHRTLPKTMLFRDLLTEFTDNTESKVTKAFIKTFTNRCKFIDKPVAKLTTADFLAYRDEQLKTVTRDSYNRSIKPLVAVFKYGIESLRFPKDCLEMVKSTRLAAKKTKRRRRFMKDEEDRFMLHCSCPTLAAVVVVLVETAMRSGELFAIRKSDVMKGLIHIPQEITKTKTPRIVALSPRGLAAVDLLAAQSATDMLVSQSKGWMKKKFRAVCASAEIRDLHMHDLRHESLSRLSESGLFGPAELMSQSGHTNLAQLGDYIHANPVLIRQKLASLGA